MDEGSAPVNGGDESGKHLTRLPKRIERKLRKLRFQNYAPRADLLKTYCEDDREEVNTTFDFVVDAHEKLIRSSNIKFMDPALDLNNLLPKKANVELKRALSEKLERLNRRTQRAIVNIALKKQMEDGDLTAPAVTETVVSSDED